jgi:hypothetical protein
MTETTNLEYDFTLDPWVMFCNEVGGVNRPAPPELFVLDLVRRHNSQHHERQRQCRQTHPVRLYHGTHAQHF